MTVSFWRRRFHEGGLTALTATAPGRGPRRRITARKVRQIVQATLHTRPPEGQRWTIRSLARAQGVGPATVQRIWDLYGLKPRLAGREGTHTQAYAQAWLERRRRFRLHPTPAGGSWLNWVGMWLGELSREQAGVRSLRSLGALEEALRTYLVGNPAQPQPFAWAGAGPKVLSQVHGDLIK